MGDVVASYWQIAQTVGCTATAERVVTRWTQGNSVARKVGTGPSRRTTPWEDRRILRLALTKRRMTTAKSEKGLLAVSPRTVRSRLQDADWDFEFPCVVYRWHHTRDFHGVEPESTGTLSGLLWCSAMSLTSVCGSQINANMSIETWWKATGNSNYRGAYLSNSWNHGVGSYWIWQHDVFGSCWREIERSPICGKNGKPCWNNLRDQGTKRGILQQDNARPHTAVHTRNALENVLILC